VKISEIITNCNDNFGILDIISENEFRSLGLSNSDLDFNFCTFIDDVKLINNISINASMIITTTEIGKSLNGLGICISENPRISFFKLHNYLADTKEYMHEETLGKEIGENCNISKLAYIAEKNVKIGNNVIIEEFVSIKENTIVGDNTIIRAGSIIGGEGFEFKRMPSDEILPVKHTGWTVINKYVEIQQNCCVDKAVFPWDKTIIGEYCKLDNLIHIAHGVKLSKGVFVAAGVLTGGRTIIKENTWVGVGAVVSNKLVIGKNASINIGAVVVRDVRDNASVTGNFAIDHKKFIYQYIKSREGKLDAPSG
jgi:acetyltransferase-like isoleucine patch superfamily enzyme